MKNDIKFMDKKGKASLPKGLYAALSVAVCAVVGVTWYTVDKTLKGTDNNIPFVSQAEKENTENEKVHYEQPLPEPQPEKDSSSEENLSASEKSVGLTGEYTDSEEPSEVYMMPVVGEIIGDYSERHVAKNITLGDWRTHDGVDLAASITTPVKCVYDGVVEKVYDDGLYGTTVVVSHKDGMESIYGNLNKLVNVSEGQTVIAGHVLGSVGNTAICETALPEHLHFEMKKDGEWINPMTVFESEE